LVKREETLKKLLERIDGRGYKAYKEIQGGYRFSFFELYIDHVQGDPFASPSRLRARVYQEKAKFPPMLFANKTRRIALEDYLARTFAREINAVCRQNRGSGKSGRIAIDCGKEEIIERSSVAMREDYVEARFTAGLPARGRTILGQQAQEMFFHEIPLIVQRSLLYENVSGQKARHFVECNEDQSFLREELKRRRLVAFIANGSILPRLSGISGLPMPAERAIAFRSPPEMETVIHLPHRGLTRGMAIPEGVTLIVGGGYHGKSTLLKAIEMGVYNHIPGDGREYVVTRQDAVKIRAEDGRRVACVNISPFINNLPFGRDTAAFSTDDASGSTSQAANIIEALEMGAKVLLIDEDTAATNFMIRDARMQKLVSKDKEPITPFIDKVKLMHRDLKVSTIMVLGGSGDYFDVADKVIMMQEYQPHDVTAEAKKIAAALTTKRQKEGGDTFGLLSARVPLGGFDASDKNKIKIAAKSLSTIIYGKEEISLHYLEQLVDISQTRAIGALIHYLGRKYVNGRRSFKEAVDLVFADLEKEGLELLSPFKEGPAGDLALPRKFELAAAINRMRSLKMKIQQ